MHCAAYAFTRIANQAVLRLLRRCVVDALFRVVLGCKEVL